MSRTLRQKKIITKGAPSIIESKSETEKGYHDEELNPRQKVLEKSADWRIGNFTARSQRCERFEDSTLPFGADQNIIYGGDLNPTVVDQINGFSGTPNPEFYSTCTPGSRCIPFERNHFFMQYRLAFGSPWMDRIFQSQFLTDTKQLCVSVNNVCGRTLVFSRYCSYLFTFASLEATPCLGQVLQNINNIGQFVAGAYLTIDPVGGSAVNAINQQILDNAIESKGFMPRLINGTDIIYPGTTKRIAIGAQFPLVGTYQSLMAQFQGGYFIAIGGCDDSCMPLDDALPHY